MTDSGNTEGIVFDIKRFALHDGPGIRTTVFLKGCPLRCSWCQNPESLAPGRELFFAADRCRGCRACVAVCPNGAVAFAENVRRHSAEKCALCGQCAEQCPADALALVGKTMRVGELMDVIERDRPFYEVSGGGLTLSGGEPLLQKAFTKELLKRAHNRALHTCLDTSAHARWDDLEELLPYTDLVLLDLKLIDPARHAELTGADNALIRQNAFKLAAADVEVIVRVPIVPAITDRNADLREMASFLHKLNGAIAVELLPYNRLAESKYARLGLARPLADSRSPDAGYMKKIEDCLAASGCPVKTVWGMNK